MWKIFFIIGKIIFFWKEIIFELLKLWLKTVKYFWRGRYLFFYLRNPALAGLHGEEREHGDEAVVVVEISPLPPGNKTQ